MTPESVARHVCSSARYAARRQLLREACRRAVKQGGLALEFGVYQGRSIRLISRYCTRVFGFDTFRGLDETWDKGHGQLVSMKKFDLAGRLPYVPSHVELIVGLFQDTLPEFLKERLQEPIGLVHVDCDIYKSTDFVLRQLEGHLRSGCILVFDELIGYSGYEHHEMRAWIEFVERTGIAYAWFGHSRFQGGLVLL